ncbi:hypothetical protein FBY31_2216 [Arthrobacter sp. SLBN-100]|uniref:hypothetical protein n=1 Tax=Arthrobacter sp. SLBN-100 TaxID=2768450 RepID=UPI001150DB69|nr:hypothetical protein [Arthrobacter sp. SLBN-100]TQJ68132.1 hypothetical protein FBY31_2216 [Arthrobacter sp. SLBN-100]
MNFPLSSRIFSRVLAALLIFNAVSSFGGAVMAIFFNGAGVPLELLAGSWFQSFLVLGLILGIILGGTHTFAAIAVPRRRPWALLASGVAGFAMLIWNFTELAIIGYSWLQSVYFGFGILELVLVLALLGIAPAIVSPWRGSPEQPADPPVQSPREAELSLNIHPKPTLHGFRSVHYP